jgi:putative ATPase
VKNDGSRPVPLHLRNAPTKLMKQLDYGKGYRYAHDEAGGYTAGETYLPPGVPAHAWYRPTERGLEAKIAERLRQLRSMDRAAGEDAGEPGGGDGDR